MITALRLQFKPATTWPDIVLRQPGVLHTLFTQVIPPAILAVAIEAAGLEANRKSVLGAGAAGTNWAIVAQAGAARLGIIIAAVIFAALLVQLVADSFNCQVSFKQGFTLIAFALFPWYIFRLADLIPGLNPWIPFAVGIGLAIAQIYHGVPLVLLPPPVQIFGLFVGCLFICVLVMGSAHLAMVAISNSLHVPVSAIRLTPVAP